MTSVTVRADFGDYAGDSDWGDSDWDSDYDSDWGDDDDWSWNDDNDDDDRYYGSYSSGGSSGGSGIDLPFPVAMVLLVLILGGPLLMRIQKMSHRSSRNKNRKQAARPVPVQKPTAKGKPIATYTERDSSFSETELKEKLSNLYVQMQNCWTAKDITPVRPYFTDAFYQQMNRQLAQKTKKNQTNYVERIAVLSVDPLTWYEENGMDHIIVVLKTRIVDYTLDDATGNLISGSWSDEKFMTYEWNISRKSGVETAGHTKMQSVSCPHCGAPLEINATAKCPYCDSTVTIAQEDWVINHIRGLGQQTVKKKR